MGAGRGNRSAPDLSPGTVQPWVVITNHTSHFWGDTLPPSVSWTGMRAGPKSPTVPKTPTAASAAGPPSPSPKALDPRVQGQETEGKT